MLSKLVDQVKFAFSKDRRRFERYDVSGAGIVRVENAIIRGRVVDISRGGFLFRPTGAAPSFLPSADMVLLLKGISLPATILRRSERGMHCRLRSYLSPDDLRALREVMEAGLEVELAERHHVAASDAQTSEQPKDAPPKSTPEVVI